MSNKWITYHGIATTAIESKNQTTLLVFCPELLPLTTGKVNGETEPITISLENSAEPQEVITINTSDTIEAIYFGVHTSNRSIPDIHVGEQLEIYNRAGSDTYYWAPAGRDDKLRRTEHIRFSAADENKTIKELTDDNTFFLEVSTKYGEKHVLISTSKSDGETFRYTIKIDAITNTITVHDDAGNELLLDSNVSRWLMMNKEGSSIDLIGSNLIINVPGNITVSTPKVLVSSDVSIGGDVSIAGDIEVAGGISGGGNTSIVGDMLVEGTITGTVVEPI